MWRFLLPKPELEKGDLRRGLRMLVIDGSFGQAMVSLSTGAFLVAFALLLGASNKTIGLCAAAGPLAQMLQMPAVYLVERMRARKLITVLAVIVSRGALLLVAALPWLVPRSAAIPVLLFLLLVHYGLGAVAGCAFNSWWRDLVPQRVMGSFFAERLRYATIVAAVLGFSAAYLIDALKARAYTPQLLYGGTFALASFLGLVGVGFLGRVPEPQMPPSPHARLREAMLEPLADRNYRSLMLFLAWWSFAVNLAAPFFAVYMLDRLGLSMTWILGLAVLSQIANVLFFKPWGVFCDRFSNKSVLAVAGPLFIVTFLLWPFTTMPEPYFLTVPILVAIHVISGVSTAGVAIAAGNFALKLAPPGRATSYLAVNGIVAGIAATIAPVMAGFAADWFSGEQVSMTLTWVSSEGDHAPFSMPTLNFSGLDFVFLLAFAFGLYATHRLLGIQERGEVGDKVVREALFSEVRRTARQISTVAGVRQLMTVPFDWMRVAGRIGDNAVRNGMRNHVR